MYNYKKNWFLRLCTEQKRINQNAGDHHQIWDSPKHGHTVGLHQEPGLVGGLEHVIFPYIVNNHPKWLSYFSEG